jgi:hypothetical protein
MDTGKDANSLSDAPNQRSHHVFASATNVTGQIATNLTGQFPVTLSRGNKNILDLYD